MHGIMSSLFDCSDAIPCGRRRRAANLAYERCDRCLEQLGTFELNDVAAAFRDDPAAAAGKPELFLLQAIEYPHAAEFARTRSWRISVWVMRHDQDRQVSV